jgi:hypothetical protein
MMQDSESPSTAVAPKELGSSPEPSSSLPLTIPEEENDNDTKSSSEVDKS